MPEWIVANTLDTAGVLAGAALVYFVVLSLLSTLAGHGWQTRTGRVVFCMLALGLLLVVIAVPLYELVAFYFRDASPGFDGQPRARNDFAHYVSWARVAFVALYGVIVLIPVAVGRFAGQHSTEHRVRCGLLAGIGVVGYMTITIPFVEFINACMVGSSLLLSSYCE